MMDQDQVGLFHVKNPTEQYLAERFPEVSAKDFYRELFPAGELAKRGEYETGKYCGIALRIGDEKVQRYSVTDDLEILDELAGTDDFCIMSPVSYAGKSAKQTNARWLYAVTVDLDEPISEIGRHGTPIGINEFFFEERNGVLPLPTYIVSSGTGLHIYYMLERPIPLYRHVIEQLQRFRHDLIFKIWNRYITNIPNPQYESVTQAFRLVGSITKQGDRVRAYRIGDKVTIEHLNGFVFKEENQVKEFRYKSSNTLAEAREKWPEWYQARIVEGRPRGTWKTNRGLYDWWKTQIEKATYGHRYFWIMALAIYAMKAGISEEELIKDALSFVPYLDQLNDQKPFTRDDALKACQMYNESYCHFPRRMVEIITAIRIDPNRRNYRPQDLHLKGARAIRDIICEANNVDWRYHGGAPTKEHVVRQWRELNPEGRKIDCERETGLSRPTVLKWWDSGQ